MKRSKKYHMSDEMNDKIFMLTLARERASRIQAGYFDGRFAPKRHVDRKKQVDRNLCRNYNFRNSEN